MSGESLMQDGAEARQGPTFTGAPIETFLARATAAGAAGDDVFGRPANRARCKDLSLETDPERPHSTLPASAA
jgi:hypothetical protein